MMVADRDYVMSKYKLHKLKDLENLVADAGMLPFPLSFTLALAYAGFTPTKLGLFSSCRSLSADTASLAFKTWTQEYRRC